jgi:hypothetical protein
MCLPVEGQPQLAQPRRLGTRLALIAAAAAQRKCDIEQLGKAGLTGSSCPSKTGHIEWKMTNAEISRLLFRHSLEILGICVGTCPVLVRLSLPLRVCLTS